MRKSVYRRGAFLLELCFDKVDGELAGEDRQCAWEFYAELVTRGAVSGHVDAKDRQAFAAQLFIAGFASLREFFVEARALMRRYPVGRLGPNCPRHLGTLIGGVLHVAVQPFLERWEARYAAWWQGQKSGGETDLLARQEEFPQLKAMTEEWCCLRALCREVIATIEETYGFQPPLLPLVPQHVRDEWAGELGELSKLSDDDESAFSDQ